MDTDARKFLRIWWQERLRAAAEGRIVLTHDRDTMPNFAYNRVRAGQTLLGVFVVSDLMPIGQAIDEILLAVECLTPEECKDLVRFFPLRRQESERIACLESTPDPFDFPGRHCTAASVWR